MAFPDYESIERPLLCYIYQNGGPTYSVLASDTYAPLAAHFGLTIAERQKLRADGRDEPLWNNMIQWARRKLKEAGYLVVAKRGVWQLSPAGVALAASKC